MDYVNLSRLTRDKSIQIRMNKFKHSIDLELSGIVLLLKSVEIGNQDF